MDLVKSSCLWIWWNRVVCESGGIELFVDLVESDLFFQVCWTISGGFVFARLGLYGFVVTGVAHFRSRSRFSDMLKSFF